MRSIRGLLTGKHRDGARTPSASALPGPTNDSKVLLTGGDEVHVVGESNYQEPLQRIAGGRREEGVNVGVVATLVREPSNPYDPNAVGVFVQDTLVGYLNRLNAIDYQGALVELELERCPATCRAIIRGGWDRGGEDKGFFGIVLDLAPPAYCRAPHWEPAMQMANPDTSVSSSVSWVDLAERLGVEQLRNTPNAVPKRVDGHRFNERALQLKSSGDEEAELRVLLQAVSELVDTPYTYERAALILERRMDYEAALKVCDAWFCLPAKWRVQGRTTEDKILRRRTRLLKKLAQ